MTTGTKVKPFREITPDGKLTLNMHPGQSRVWKSRKRYIDMQAGSQGGKTCFGPHWLDREIRTCGPGDYLIGTATFPLLDRKLLPEFLYVFEYLLRYGTYNDNKKVFTFFNEKTVKNKSDYILFPNADVDTKIFIGSAQNPESMESATVKAIWLDECGMKMFKRETWEAVERRGLINKARILFTTTLYCLGWFKTEIYDRWVNGDPDIDVIQFDSIENPAFPLDEYQRMQKSMPGWKFNMMHRGRFDKPTGLIYDAFDSANDVVEPFEIPSSWPRYVGHDFGPVNTVALWKAYDPMSSTIYTYREYSMGQLSTFEHVTNWIELSKNERIATRMGGSLTEDGWRGDFTQAGWRIDKPLDGNVWSGINRVYGFEKLHKHKVFRTCKNYLAEKQTFSRELDANYNPIEDKIEDAQIYHLMACLVGETLVTTEDGLKPIRDVRVGDKVLTRQGYYPVRDKIEKVADTIEAKFSNGQILQGTPEHNVFVKEKGFLPLTALRYYDTVETWNEKQLFTGASNIIGIRKQRGGLIGSTSGLAGVISTGLSGRITLAQYLGGVVSTIGTIILRIMNSLILNVKDLDYTYQNILKMVREYMTLNTLPEYVHSQLSDGSNGLLLQRAKPTLVREQSKNGQINNQLPRCANSAGKNTKPLNPPTVSSVHQLAKQPTGMLPIKMMNSVNAESVANLFSLTDTHLPELAQENAVRFINTTCKDKTTVYDLNIDTVHEYYANGILVHNSERYMMTQFRPLSVLSDDADIALVGTIKG